MYGYPSKGYNIERLFHILLDSNFDCDYLCSDHPVLVQNNVCFVVDLSTLKSRDDIRADDLGTWKCTGSRVHSFSAKMSNGQCLIVNDESATHIVHIRRQYHVHGTDSDLHRMVAFLEDVQSKSQGKQHRLTSTAH